MDSAALPRYWYRQAFPWRGNATQNRGRRMSFPDVIYVLFLLICAWLASSWDSEGGGGKRARLPLRA